MAKPKKEIQESLPVNDNYLPWPTHERDISQEPRLYRIHRIDAFAWQAFVLDKGMEYPIGKPDTFDLVRNRVSGCMQREGQVEFMAAKKNREELSA